MPEIYTVSELTALVKRCLEKEFPSVWVKGQISNLSRPSSGHVYFTLKDAHSSCNVVWFRSSRIRSQGFDPLTGEVFESGASQSADALADGKEVLCGGRLTVYPPRGVYQLVADMVQEVGVGRLFLEFEALKRRFAAKGYFDQERKRPIPRNPGHVALVAAPDSAAVQDFLRISRERGYGGAIRIYPTLVQGGEAPAQIAAALRLANEHAWADVAVMIRGGGSMEDLWAFNAEEVAEAVFQSALPVVAGIGHEVDISIADLVADMRAATPSHAAQLLYEEREPLMQLVDGKEIALAKAWARIEQNARLKLDHLQRALEWRSPLQRVRRALELLAQLHIRLNKNAGWLLRDREAALEQWRGRLQRAWGHERLQEKDRLLQVLTDRFQLAARRQLSRQEALLDRLALKLNASDPERPLTKGYGLVRVRATGRYVRNVAEVSCGEELDIRVRDGTIGARVEHVATDTPEAS